MPLPIARYARRKIIKFMMEDLDFQAVVEYSTIDKTNYIGYIMNLSVSSNGVANNLAFASLSAPTYANHCLNGSALGDEIDRIILRRPLASDACILRFLPSEAFISIRVQIAPQLT
jgi:hypothetical protein